jgi:hypothetical protein
MATEESRGLAAQAWCTPETRNKVMDVELAEAFATILDKQILSPQKIMTVLGQLDLSANPEFTIEVKYNVKLGKLKEFDSLAYMKLKGYVCTSVGKLEQINVTNAQRYDMLELYTIEKMVYDFNNLAERVRKHGHA